MTHDPTNDPVAWMAQQLANDPNLNPALAAYYQQGTYVRTRWVNCGACQGTGLGCLVSRCVSCDGNGEVIEDD